MPFTHERIEVASSVEFVIQGTRWLSERIQKAIAEKGSCIMGLSGGSTPGPVYKELGKDATIDWTKVYVFLADDRYVPAADKNSNQNFLRTTLLKHGPIPEKNIFLPNTALPIANCIEDYAAKLSVLFTYSPPDILVLGMGPDGHIASLFPPLPKEAFSESLVLHTTTDVFPVHDRISVSPLIIMSALAHLLLLQGDNKKQALEEMAASEMNPVRWPMHLALATGRTTVIIDTETAKVETPAA